MAVEEQELSAGAASLAGNLPLGNVVPYRQQVLPRDRLTFAVEAGRSLGGCAWADTGVAVHAVLAR